MPDRIPPLIVGLILLTYWLRVMYMVRKTRILTGGHGANYIPPEPLGKFLRIIWNPVVVIWIFLPILNAYKVPAPAGLEPLYYHPIIAWSCVAVVVAAFILTWICWKKMGKSWRMGIDPNEKTQLVFSGPFAYVRNPIYGLSSLIMFMTVIMVPSIVMIVTGLLHLLLLQWEVRREEKYLIEAHGDPYRNYLANVGRFLPKSIRPYSPN